MGYLVVTAVLVVTFGRLGDIFGRVRMYNAGFAVFTAGVDRAVAHPVDRQRGRHVADRLARRAGRRRRAADGQLHRHPHRRLPGRRARAWPWASTWSRASPARSSAWSSAACSPTSTGALVFWVNVPFGVFGTVWAYLKLREIGVRAAGQASTGAGNLTFAVGLDHDPRRHHLRHAALRRPHHGLDQPVGAVRADRRRRRCWSLFVLHRAPRRRTRCSTSTLFRIRAFTAGNIAGLARRRSGGAACSSC